MKSEKELREELNGLEMALNLKHKGIVSIRKMEFAQILRKVDFLKEVLEEKENE